MVSSRFISQPGDLVVVSKGADMETRKVTMPIDEALKFIRTEKGMKFAEAVDKAVELKCEDVTIAAAPNDDGTFDVYVEEVVDPEVAKAAMTKAVVTKEEQRYTLAPFYLPDTLDAHDEHTDMAELEKAFHKYMALPDGDIRLQHNRDIVAGHRTDGVVWPFPVTLPMTKANGTVVHHTFPAGTPFLGVTWEPYAWDGIKEGKFNGYSMGGTSHRLEADLPVAE